MNRNTNWKSKVEIKVLFKKALPFNVNSKVKKSMILIRLQAPSQPTLTSLGQLLITKMRQSKFLIPNYDYQMFMMTPITLNIHYISICDPTMLSTSKAKKETCENCTTCCAHQIEGFSWFVDCIGNHWNNYGLFFKVEINTSSTNATCPKKISSSSIVTSLANIP
jgi:hypothetical protein